MSQADPIRDNYYSAVEQADRATDYLFYLAGFCSFVALFIEQRKHPIQYDWIQILYAVTVVGLFALSIASRLYFIPRAENKRRQDFFGHGFGVNLTHEKTAGYYNNGLSEPLQRMAAQAMENSFFTKSIALRMARRERVIAACYFAAWLACLFHRKPEISTLVWLAQLVLSEQIVAKCLRLEWLRSNSERIFNDLYRLFHTSPPTNQFNALALEFTSEYETAKTNAAIVLDSKLFRAMNPSLSQEWERIKSGLHL